MMELTAKAHKEYAQETYGKSLWMRDGCPYYNNDSSTAGLICLLCREVAHIFDRLKEETAREV